MKKISDKVYRNKMIKLYKELIKEDDKQISIIKERKAHNEQKLKEFEGLK